MRKSLGSSVKLNCGPGGVMRGGSNGMRRNPIDRPNNDLRMDCWLRSGSSLTVSYVITVVGRSCNHYIHCRLHRPLPQHNRRRHNQTWREECFVTRSAAYRVSTALTKHNGPTRIPADRCQA